MFKYINKPGIISVDYANEVNTGFQEFLNKNDNASLFEKYGKYNRWLPENFTHSNRCYINNKFILINIPKNASSSMKNALKMNQIVNFFKGSSNTHKKTCVVIRDPNTRIISIFSELLKLRGDGPYWETSQSEWFKIYKENPKKNIKKSFNLFLDYIENRLYDSHLHTQTSWLEGKKISLKDIDYVLLFENLNNDFKKMCEEMKLPYRINWSNKTTNSNLTSTLKELIDNDETIKNSIKNIYREDFILHHKACKLIIS